jgi:hypothetical protein
MKVVRLLAVSAAFVATSLGVEQPSFHTKGAPTGKPSGKLKPGEYWWHPEISPNGPVTVLVSLPEQTIHVFHNGEPIGRAELEVSGGKRLGNHVFTMLEGTTGLPSRVAPGREAKRWMRVTGQGRAVDPDKIASRLHFSPEFGQKVTDELKPGTTVLITDQVVVRKPSGDAGIFSAN